MARPLRLEFEGAWYHVMNRGAGHREIYKTNEHRIYFLNLIREAGLYFNIECHAYCLMDNHYHLIIHTPQANLAQAMRHINGLYTQQYNRTEQQDGALFRGRYKAILIEQDAYLLHVSRYIHLNPVDAKMVTCPENYPWSSYLNYIKKTPVNPWLRTEMILNLLCKHDHKYAYQNFVNAGVDEDTKHFYALKKQPTILGRAIFKTIQLRKVPEKRCKESMPDINRTQELPTLEQVNKICSMYFNVSEKSLLNFQRGSQNMPRRIAMYLSKIVTQRRLEEIAKYYNCFARSSVSNAIYKVKQNINNDAMLAKKIREIEIKLRG